jgi:anti-sigma factor RsiW
MNQQPVPGLTVTCQEVVELVTAFLEGELDGPMTAEIEAHLRLCPGCAEYLNQIRTTIQALGQVSVDTLSDAAQAELLKAFRDLYPTAPP